MAKDSIQAIECALSEVTGRPVIGSRRETRFDRDLHLDSYMFVQFLLALEDRIPGLRFNSDAIAHADFNVVSGLAGYIRSSVGRPSEYANA